MAKGLDELIEYLLGEIAISARRGVTINDVAGFVTSFYARSGTELHEAAAPAPHSTEPRPVADERFLSKLWRWLGQHPDVSIGDNRKYNETSLAEVDLEFPGYLDAGFKGIPKQDESGTGPIGSEDATGAPQAQPAAQRPRARAGPRISVNDERIYRALCGHPPDPSKINPLEFVLLSHIATARTAGILQGELTRTSGQDKRSVPKRTDSLHKKGYIVKDIVYRKGNRTSVLFLQRFAPSDAGTGHDRDPLAQHASSVRDVVRRIFDILTDTNLVPISELAEKLNMESPADSAVLVKIIRRLERLKFVKRVKTATGPSATSSDVKQYVQFLRLAGPNDLEDFDNDNISLDASIQHLASMIDPEYHNSSAVGFSATEGEGENNENVPSAANWNPDRLIAHALVDAARLAGLTGMTNWDARQMTTGLFTRRTVESLLLRISFESLIVQPRHLRHLAIVRTSMVSDGVAQFLHYSWDAFQQRVKEHTIDLTGIPGAKQALKALTEDGPSTTDTTSSLPLGKVDEFGFPMQSPPALQVKDGKANVEELIKMTGAKDVEPRHGEPVVVRDGPNDLLRLREDTPATPRTIRAPARQDVSRKSRSARKKQSPKGPKGPGSPGAPKPAPENIPLGRPRKYARGTEKFWRVLFKSARSEAGVPSSQSTKGIMQDPSGLALHARRPESFDKALVDALEAGLPVPMLPQDIGEPWIRSTRNILNRSSDGVYMTLRGRRSDGDYRPAQVMIVRSSRLSSVDFSDRAKVHPVRFISSSASHSLAALRYYPPLEPTTAQKSAYSTRTPRRRIQGISVKRDVGKQPGPPVGVFYEVRNSPEGSFQATPEVDLGIQLGTLMDTTDDDEALTNTFGQNFKYSTPQRLGQKPPTDTPSEAGSSPNAEDRAESFTPVRARHADAIPPSPRRRPPRRRKLTQKASEYMDSGEASSLYLRDSRSTSSGVQVADAAGQPHQHDTSVEEVQESSIPHTPVTPPKRDEFTVLDPDKSIAHGSVATPEEQHPSPSLEGPKTTPILDNALDHQSNSIDTGKYDMPDVGPIPSPSPLPNIAVRTPAMSPELIGGDKDEAVFQDVSTPSPRKQKTSRKRRRASDSGSADETPQSRRQIRVKPYNHGANALVRKLIVQLVQETCGVVPNDAFTIKRVSTPRWQEAGLDDRPLLKTIKSAIKTLCEQGKLKQATFTFRGKSNAMVKRSLIFLPTINALSTLVEDIRQKIVAAEPTDYIPPEWILEASRIPLVGKKMEAPTSDVEDTPPRRRRHGSSAAPVPSIDTPTRRSTRSPTREPIQPSPPPREPSPPPRPATAATGFLTLKIPSLASLPVSHLHNWTSVCPVHVLRLDNSPRNPWRLTARQPLKKRRGGRQAVRPQGNSIVWQNFPSSLQDILQRPDLKLDYDEFVSDNVNFQRFACEVEGVRAWEEQDGDTFLARRTEFGFINHCVPEALYEGLAYPRIIDFAGQVLFDQDGCDYEEGFPPAESWPPFRAALGAAPEVARRIVAAEVAEPTSMPPPANEDMVRRSARRPKRKARTYEDGDFSPEPKRQKRGTRLQRITTPRRTLRGSFAPRSRKAARGVQHLRFIPQDTVYHIVVCVVVVRTLAGGVDGFIDWPIVASLLPEFPENFINERWKTLSKKYAHDIRGLTENLQTKYLSSLELGEVPSVNYGDITSTDWAGIVDWALTRLDRFNTSQVDDLPATREELISTNDLTFGEPKPFYSTLLYVSKDSNPVRENVVSSVVFGQRHRGESVLGHVPPYELEMADGHPDLRLAKSWALAAILTPDAQFDPGTAHAKLSTLAATPQEVESLLTDAVRLLQGQHVVQRVNPRETSGWTALRAWEIHKRLPERFEERAMITADMLRRAAEYKLGHLDAAFSRGESVTLDKDDTEIHNDGEMVAVLNLMATGQVRPNVGDDVPRTRYGLEHERIGYRTKNMSKKVLAFSVVLTATDSYRPGVPLTPVPVPRGEADALGGVIPAWIDINGSVQSNLWQMFLAGVLGTLVQMPGLTPLDLSRCLGYALDPHDVELMLGWCVAAGFAKVHGPSKGYETTEWWWLCLA